MHRVGQRLILAFAGPVLIGSSEPPKQATPSEPVKAAKQRSPTLSRAVTKTIGAPNTFREAGSCGPSRYQSNHELCAQWKAADSASEAAQWTKLQTIFSALGILGLLASLHYTRKAVKAAEDATGNANDALVIARRNADAASKLADISNEAMERQLRAYVNAGSPVFVQHFDPTIGKYWWSFCEVMTNFGRTPAHNVKTQLWPELRQDKLPVDFPFDKTDPSTMPAVIGPMGTIRTAKVNISADQAQQIYDGELYFYLWGWAAYEDVFADSVPRKTRFCYRVTVMGDLAKEIGPHNVIQWNFDYHGSHNDAT